jgi:hypothetical protein
MQGLKITGLVVFGYLLSTQQVLAAIPVPEIDGSGAIIGIGLLAGVVALFREKFFRK